MARPTTTLFIECQRCRHKAQREVELPLPPGARWRCKNCSNREQGTIKVWHTGGSSSVRVLKRGHS